MRNNTVVCPVVGRYCTLYKLNGNCAYPGGSCLDVVEQCEGCPNVINNRCKIYPNPPAKWKPKSGCPRRRRKLSSLDRKRIFKRNPLKG